MNKTRLRTLTLCCFSFFLWLHREAGTVRSVHSRHFHPHLGSVLPPFWLDAGSPEALSSWEPPSPPFPSCPLFVQVANTWPSGQAICHNLQVRLGLHPSSPCSVAPAPDPLPSPGNASADILSALSPSILTPGPHLVLSACFLTTPLPSFSKSCRLSPQHGGHRWFSV